MSESATTPTPIDPADIRVGDVVERRAVMTVRNIEDDRMETTRGSWWHLDRSDATWHLVHRPDPDAEARVCAWAEYRKDYAPNPPHEAAAHKAFVAGWQAAREFVRRAES